MPCCNLFQKLGQSHEIFTLEFAARNEYSKVNTIGSVMKANAIDLDHAGVAGRDLDLLAAAYQRLGFTLTPRARHSGRRTPDGLVEPFGTANRCIMLRQGYLELIAIVDASCYSNGLDRFLARHPGLHIIALSIGDESKNLRRLRQAGIDIPGVAWLERPVDDADPNGLRARFARLPLPDAPEGRIQLIRHLTPEAIWQPRFLDHANHAGALEEVVLAVENPAESAARFSLLAGRHAVANGAGGYTLNFERSRLRLLPAKALQAELPEVNIASLPLIAAITISTDDSTRAIRGLVEGIAHREVPGGIVVAPEAAGGAAIIFK